jgi:PAS domain S-box-containing protein
MNEVQDSVRMPPRLRSRMSSLIVLAFIPAFIGLAVDAYFSKNLAIDNARNSSREEVMFAAASQEKQIRSINDLLGSIASVASLAEIDKKSCSEQLHQLLKTINNFTNTGILDRDGNLICSAILAESDENYAQRRYFQEARSRNSLATSELLKGGISKQNVIVFSYPIYNKDKQFNGVTFAAFKDTQFASLPLSGKSNITARFAYFDRNGRFIASDPLDTKPVTNQLEMHHMEMARQHPGQAVTFDLQDDNGKRYLAALAAVGNSGNTVAYIRGVVQHDQVLDAWFSSVVRRAASVGIALLCALALVWWLLEKWLVRDLMRLVEFARSASGNVIPTFTGKAQTAETEAAMQSFSHMTRTLHEQREKLRILHDEANLANAELEKRVEQRTRELERSERLYRTLAEAIPQIVWSGTTEGGIHYVNKTWGSYFEAPAFEPLGHAWIDYFHDEDRERAISLWQKCVQESTPFTGQFRLKTITGEYRHYLLASAPLMADDGTVEMWAGVGTDITEMKQAEETLVLANDELQSFSYSVSHDLKAPLNAINGLTTMLLSDHGDKLDFDARRYLERICASSEHMAGLIDDLLKLAQLSVMESQPREIDLSLICDEIVLGLRENEPHRNIEIQIDPNMTLHADARLMQVAMTNLISNAWKFTQKSNSPYIHVGRHVHNGGVVYFVKDNGVGFDMRYADKLFGVFQRLHSSKEFPGTGIGLATVRRIITRHTGKIWVKAKPNEGATFYFAFGGVFSAQADIAAQRGQSAGNR